MEEVNIYISDRDNIEHHIIVPLDVNLNIMELCKANELPVEGTCGGMALCASCHIYVLSDHDLDHPSYDEIFMLDQAFFVEQNSRLGCQIKINEKLEGFRAKLAPVGE